MPRNLTPAEVQALKREISSSLHCALPGIVESFDAVSQTACIRPAVRKASAALPVLRDVPVFFPGSRGSGITWPVEAGDECLLVFADFDIDRWFETGEESAADSARQQVPEENRDLTNGCARAGGAEAGRNITANVQK